MTAINSQPKEKCINHPHISQAVETCRPKKWFSATAEEISAQMLSQIRSLCVNRKNTRICLSFCWKTLSCHLNGSLRSNTTFRSCSGEPRRIDYILQAWETFWKLEIAQMGQRWCISRMYTAFQACQMKIFPLNAEMMWTVSLKILLFKTLWIQNHSGFSHTSKAFRIPISKHWSTTIRMLNQTCRLLAILQLKLPAKSL
jgi:hypothetical protein